MEKKVYKRLGDFTLDDLYNICHNHLCAYCPLRDGTEAMHFMCEVADKLDIKIMEYRFSLEEEYKL